jgi:hypothetical protein
VSIVNYGANPATGDYPIGAALGVDDLDVDALDDTQALALQTALQQRAARREQAFVREQQARDPLVGMSRAELDALRVLAAPHPLSTVRD